MSYNVFVGYDNRQITAYNVCEHSLVRRASEPVEVVPLLQASLRYSGLYSRPYKVDAAGQFWDEMTNTAFSTEFSFTRFLTGEIAKKNDINGWVLFCDNDFLFREDVIKLFSLAQEKYAVMCVKHQWSGLEGKKMDGKLQEFYPRKLWSSLFLWNVRHPGNARLMVEDVNTRTGKWLHAFSWLKESEVGELPHSWNYIPGFSLEQDGLANAVHFSYGMPDLPMYANCEYAQEWRKELAHLRAATEKRKISL